MPDNVEEERFGIHKDGIIIPGFKSWQEADDHKTKKGWGMRL